MIGSMVQMIVVFGEIGFLMNVDSDEGLAVCFWGCMCWKTLGDKMIQIERAANGRPFYLYWEEDFPVFLTAFAACVIR